MKKIFNCRRSILAIIGIACLTYLGYANKLDVSLAVAGIVTAVAGANAYEKKS